MGLTSRSVHQSLAPAPVEGTWNAWVRFLVEILAAVGDRMLRPPQSALLKAGDHIQLIPPRILEDAATIIQQITGKPGH